jgi:uncharacterized protein YceH (UPF0502 family)
VDRKDLEKLMSTILDEIEVRVLGSLIEKQVTTPEYYPLTLNSLTLACNQKNNRYPVTAFDEAAVARALETLREKNLVYVVYGSTSRVPKYKHVVTDVLHLSQAELATMCVLMLRGPQTTGEVAGRGYRLYEFSGLEEVEATMNSLISREPEPLVVRLPRQPGQKEVRFANLLSGEVSVEQVVESQHAQKTGSSRGGVERTQKLEQEVEALRADVAALQQQFLEFKKQFE